MRNLNLDKFLSTKIFTTTLILYLCYIAGHVITKVPVKVPPLIVLLVIIAIQCIVVLVQEKFKNISKRIFNILISGVFQYGLMLFVVLVDYTKGYYILTLVICLLAGGLFGVLINLISEKNK
ncbi:hypothetical protein [uncultured Clostridium sp.]|jgi:FtsH-binding integral membrane protein|uniref:hypothetical protein n=1 Tax=uncultured Clostridium sp. TaxID=59620 RepID=UPI002613A3AC|nr:hypothetical protein [uncultured Clostridium sp.]